MLLFNLLTVDFARIFPPEDPGNLGNNNRKMFYTLLRPEFVGYHFVFL
jgi:hypothetical protein